MMPLLLLLAECLTQGCAVALGWLPPNYKPKTLEGITIIK